MSIFHSYSKLELTKKIKYIKMINIDSIHNNYTIYVYPKIFLTFCKRSVISEKNDDVHFIVFVISFISC